MTTSSSEPPFVANAEVQAAEAPIAPAPGKPVEAKRYVMPASTAVVLAWVVVAVVNANAIAKLPFGKLGRIEETRRIHHLVDASHTLAIGLVLAGIVVLWQRFVPRNPLRTLAALTLASIAFFEIVLAKDLAGAAERWSHGKGTTLLRFALCAALALTIPFGVIAGQLLARVYLRVLGIAAGIGIIAFNERVLVNGYPDGHVWIALSGATLLAASLHGMSAGSWLSARLAWFTPRLRLAAYVGLCLLVAPALVLRLPSRVSLELLERDTALLARALILLHAHKRIEVTVPPDLKPWFEPRAGRAAIPPHPTRVMPPAPIVILITIDALRLDVLSPKNARVAPNLQDLKKHSVYFSQTRSLASDTRYSLSALFAGRYFSMLKWTKLDGPRPELGTDKLPRLPELLRPLGVQSATAISFPRMLAPQVRVIGGFDEHAIVDDGTKLAGTPAIMKHAHKRLREQGAAPLFYYTHLLDPHLPYYKHGTRAKKSRDAYHAEVKYVDGYIGQLRKAIRDLGLADRTMLIVSSDHGEAFGEHGLKGHNKPLYDVMVHVPLMIEYPGVKPRVIDTPVSLMDVGPTVLDVFGAPTPGYWMAESLVPLLLGEPPKPNRVIYMERRESRAMLFPDKLKVMLNDSPLNEEIYDLSKDPGEEEDLRDALGDEGDRRAALVRAYLAAHAWPKGDPPVPLR
jgi:arylsulfatase A-like enzyme